MRTIKDLIGTKKDKSALIIGAGATIKEEEESIYSFIRKTKPFVIGINNMTAIWTPDFHLWTNTQRFRTYGKNIRSPSNLLLGSNISLKVINEVIGSREYTLINYTDMKEDIPMCYKNGKIYGYYRTAGCLAIMIVHLMGATDISIVGMDGYSLHEHKALESGEESQHCYDKGFTDTADWETCVKKDKLIEKALGGLENHGIDFKILTPTKYRRFYDSTRLYI